jgi:hypothetical protein
MHLSDFKRTYANISERGQPQPSRPPKCERAGRADTPLPAVSSSSSQGRAASVRALRAARPSCRFNSMRVHVHAFINSCSPAPTSRVGVRFSPFSPFPLVKRLFHSCVHGCPSVVNSSSSVFSWPPYEKLVPPGKARPRFAQANNPLGASNLWRAWEANIAELRA